MWAIVLKRSSSLCWPGGRALMSSLAALSVGHMRTSAALWERGAAPTLAPKLGQAARGAQRPASRPGRAGAVRIRVADGVRGRPRPWAASGDTRRHSATFRDARVSADPRRRGRRTMAAARRAGRGETTGFTRGEPLMKWRVAGAGGAGQCFT